MLPAALFRSDELHRREITLGDGSVHELTFREMTHAQELKMREIARADGDHVSYMIACSLCDEDGTLALTEAQAADMKRGVRNALVTAIMDLNGAGATMGKASPPAANAGSSTS
jgi:Phage tail assembly chaperone, TAC